MTTNFSEAQIDAITKSMVDSGKIIEAGWFGLKAMIFPNGCPEIQEREMRTAFFAGSQHLYTSILRCLEDGDEPTDKDMNRMSLIDAELKEFIDDFQTHHLPTKGSA